MLYNEIEIFGVILRGVCAHMFMQNMEVPLTIMNFHNSPVGRVQHKWNADGRIWMVRRSGFAKNIW